MGSDPQSEQHMFVTHDRAVGAFLVLQLWHWVSTPRHYAASVDPNVEVKKTKLPVGALFVMT